MTPKMNKNDASAVTGRLARHPFAKMLLMALGILLSVSRPGMAAPGNGDHGNTGRAGGVTFIFQVIKDYSVAPGGTDILEVSEIPALPPNALVSVSVGGSSSSGATTDASGNAYFYLKNSTPGTITFTFTDASGNTANYDMHFIAAPGPPTAANSFFGISQNDADADGVAQDQVTAYLFDQYGNPVPNGSVV
ncbi:MAG TPA: hypothetical protein VNU70_10675, partial [Puia sp.]|nr:hypothetical protein [Puia sp.]